MWNHGFATWRLRKLASCPPTEAGRWWPCLQWWLEQTANSFGRCEFSQAVLSRGLESSEECSVELLETISVIVQIQGQGWGPVQKRIQRSLARVQSAEVFVTISSGFTASPHIPALCSSPVLFALFPSSWAMMVCRHCKLFTIPEPRGVGRGARQVAGIESCPLFNSPLLGPLKTFLHFSLNVQSRSHTQSIHTPQCCYRNFPSLSPTPSQLHNFSFSPSIVPTWVQLCWQQLLDGIIWKNRGQVCVLGELQLYFFFSAAM